MANVKAWKSENEREVAESYWDTLTDLKFNSRPLIVTLTELARDYSKICPHVIVTLIERRIVNGHDAVRLPALYLMDSIIKNHADPYKPLFEKGLVSLFAHVFKQSDEKGRLALFKLRNTWTPLFTSDVLNSLDLKVQTIDPAWPVAKVPANQVAATKHKIHVNPAYFQRSGQQKPQQSTSTASAAAVISSKTDEVRRMEEELLELKKKKLQLELEAARKAMEEATKNLETPAGLEPSSSKKVQQKHHENGSGAKKVVEDKKDQLLQMLDIKKEPKIEKLEKRKQLVVPEEDKKKRSKSRSPSRQLPTSTSNDDEAKASKSSTPPPPPNIREDFKKIKATHEDPEKSSSSRHHSKKKKSASRERNSEASHNQDKTKKPFKIPKKRNFRKRTPSPPLQADKSPAKKIRSDLPINAMVEEQQMPSGGGWAKLKESHPDEFRPPPPGPFQDQRPPQHVHQRFFGPHRFGNRRPPHHQGPPRPPNPWRNQGGPPPPMRGPGPNFHGGPPRNPHPQWAENYDIMQEAMQCNPEYFMDQVIPAIIREGQMQLRQGRINPDEFSELMRQVDMMRAQAVDQLQHRSRIENKENGPLMHHDPMQHSQEAGGPWQFNRGPPVDQMGPGGGPPPPFRHNDRHEQIQQQEQFNNPPAASPMEEEPDRTVSPAKASTSKMETDHPSNVPEVSKKQDPVDVQKLWASLVGVGLIKSTNNIPGLDSPTVPKKDLASSAAVDKASSDDSTKKKQEPKEEPAKKKIKWETTVKKVKPVVLKSHDPSIRTKQEGIVERLYDPMALQCKNCGLRFAPSDMAYSQHLDWHFRMKKREKDNHKRAQSRRWYLEQADWIISNEIEDNLNEVFEDEEAVEQGEAEIPTVPASADPDENRCPVCHEDFDQLFKEENPDLDDDAGQWHLKNAIRPDGPGTRAYHPLCHGDAKNLELEFEDEDEPEPEPEPQPEAKPELAAAPGEEDKIQVKEEQVNAEVADTAVEVKTEPVEAESTEPPTESTDNNEPMDQDGSGEGVKTEKVDEDQADEAEIKEEPEDPDENKQADRSLNDLGNLTAEAGVTAPPAFPTSSGIKINLTSQASAPGSPRDDGETEKGVKQEESMTEESEFDPEAIIQEKSECSDDPFLHKPRLRGRKLTEMPMIDRGSDLSGLCSIM